MNAAHLRNGTRAQLRRIAYGICACVLAIIVSRLVYGPTIVTQAAEFGLRTIAVFVTQSPDTAYTSGIRYMRLSHDQNINHAQYFFERVLEMNPAYGGAHYHLGRIHFLNGDFDMAYDHTMQEIALRGDSFPESYYMKGLILGYGGYYSEAAKAFQHFLSIDPDNPNTWAALNDYAWALLRAGEPDKAASVLIDANTRFPGNAWVVNSLAVALTEAGYPEEALPYARYAVKLADALTIDDVAAAYPGNGYDASRVGLETFRESARNNMHLLEGQTQKDAVE